jgi:hypothetical protein
MHPHGPSFQILGPGDSGIQVVEHGPMMKISGREHGNGSEGFPKTSGAQVSRESHLADIEFQIAHHAPHGRDNWVNLNEVQGQVAARRASIAQGLGKTGAANGYR